MGVIDHPGALRLGGRVDAEDDADGLAPVGLLLGRVEQPPLGAMVAFVIGGDVGRVRGAILERGYPHRLAPASAIAPFARRFTKCTPQWIEVILPPSLSRYDDRRISSPAFLPAVERAFLVIREQRLPLAANRIENNTSVTLSALSI